MLSERPACSSRPTPATSARVGIGATFEGILRKHSLRADGPGLRDVAMFSIIDEDWPAVRALLEQRVSA